MREFVSSKKETFYASRPLTSDDLQNDKSIDVVMVTNFFIIYKSYSCCKLKSILYNKINLMFLQNEQPKLITLFLYFLFCHVKKFYKMNYYSRSFLHLLL